MALEFRTLHPCQHLGDKLQYVQITIIQANFSSQTLTTDQRGNVQMCYVNCHGRSKRIKYLGDIIIGKSVVV